MLIEFSGSKTELIQTNKTAEKIKHGNSNVNSDNTNKKSFSFFHNKIKEKKSGYSGYNKVEKIIKENDNKLFQIAQLSNSLSITANTLKNSTVRLKDNEKNIENTQTDSINKTVNQLNNIDSVQNTANKKFISINKQRKLYIGFVAAPEFNQIKNQGIKKPGFDIGVIAGYKLSNKAFLETGVLLNKKNYFSDGKYFSMDKIGAAMPAGMEVMSLKGSSTFLQIPIKLKYDLLRKKNATIFSSAGISSYIITDEENDYLTLLNGTEQQMKGSYKNVTKYFAATFDVSAGYENKIGKFTSVRIEPYVQIPLKGVGVGSMPVMSAGLHVGIIKFIR